MSAAKMVADSTQADLPEFTTGKKRKKTEQKKKGKKKKDASKKKKKASEDEFDDDSDLDLEKPLYALGHYVKARETLLDQLFHCMRGGTLERNMPDVLKDLPLEDLRRRCLEQLEVMSKKRIRRILAGDEPATISSSGTEDETSEDEQPLGLEESVPAPQEDEGQDTTETGLTADSTSQPTQSNADSDREMTVESNSVAYTEPSPERSVDSDRNEDYSRSEVDSGSDGDSRSSSYRSYRRDSSRYSSDSDDSYYRQSRARRYSRSPRPVRQVDNVKPPVKKRVLRRVLRRIPSEEREEGELSHEEFEEYTDEEEGDGAKLDGGGAKLEGGGAKVKGGSVKLDVGGAKLDGDGAKSEGGETKVVEGGTKQGDSINKGEATTNSDKADQHPCGSGTQDSGKDKEAVTAGAQIQEASVKEGEVVDSSNGAEETAKNTHEMDTEQVGTDKTGKNEKVNIRPDSEKKDDSLCIDDEDVLKVSDSDCQFNDSIVSNNIETTEVRNENSVQSEKSDDNIDDTDRKEHKLHNKKGDQDTNKVVVPELLNESQHSVESDYCISSDEKHINAIEEDTNESKPITKVTGVASGDDECVTIDNHDSDNEDADDDAGDENISNDEQTGNEQAEVDPIRTSEAKEAVDSEPEVLCPSPGPSTRRIVKPPAKAAPLTKTQMEILELEMRARAIKAMLKKSK